MKEAKEVEDLQVFKNGTLAGKLVRTQQGCELLFDPQFLKASNLTRLTFHLPLQAEPLIYPGVGLPSYFAGLLPEGLRLKALVRKVKTSDDDRFQPAGRLVLQKDV